ncbi:MAG: hypothetical protein ACRES7_12230, partial [Gammaproteobacteria bacterium]
MWNQILRRLSLLLMLLGMTTLGGCAGYYSGYSGGYYPAGYAYAPSVAVGFGGVWGGTWHGDGSDWRGRGGW